MLLEALEAAFVSQGCSEPLKRSAPAVPSPQQTTPLSPGVGKRSKSASLGDFDTFIRHRLDLGGVSEPQQASSSSVPVVLRPPAADGCVQHPLHKHREWPIALKGCCTAPLNRQGDRPVFREHTSPTTWIVAIHSHVAVPEAGFANTASATRPPAARSMTSGAGPSADHELVNARTSGAAKCFCSLNAGVAFVVGLRGFDDRVVAQLVIRRQTSMNRYDAFSIRNCDCHISCSRIHRQVAGRVR